MARLFGTDGVRGIANVELTNEIAYRLGQAAVRFLGKTIVVGKDTRLSGDMLEAAMVAGITSAGGTALLAGIVPTPAVALLTRKLSAAGGAVISASHNPPQYNGIKLFDSKGYKLSDDAEDAIEAFIDAGGLEGVEDDMPQGADVGFSVDLNDAAEIYIQHAVDAVRGQDVTFEGLTVALDTGHGASSVTTAEALERLGAAVHVINDDFDGMDINVECGSTHLGPVKQLVSDKHADVGIAHDGDADRVMMVTPAGVEIDGDIVEAVIALDMKRRGILPADTVVSTVMCNLGFVHAMRDAGIQVVQTKVGDRYVLEEMRAQGYAIGGEQSGHMILLEHNSTGDGLMTAVQFLAAVKRSGITVEEAAATVSKFPQELINVPVADKEAVATSEAVAAAVAAAEAELGDDGRVLLRPSGTEPVVRVMVEAKDADMAQRIAERVAASVAAE
ncbi:phosphoglucosamine mutase [Adlercreutzia murintestinalis]|uniref:phosphoglucosamine mutase n=1 Tax=Adlercreutzia murintestinalis TaxID=2941325 RepID=UPI00203EE8DB|nr:phosphoglucosamine mutase [Adlercreutzia murintestinalis]